MTSTDTAKGEGPQEDAAEAQGSRDTDAAAGGASTADAQAGTGESAPRSKGSRKKGKSKKSKQPAAESEALNSRLLRLQADFDNFRKRTLREKNELYRRANEDIIVELLPVLDHLDLALKAADEHDAPAAFVDGFRMVGEQLQAALGKFNVTAIDAVGEEFDFNLHEAVSHLPSEDVPENHVIAQVRRGYKLGDMLLRPAQVVVSSGVSES